MIGRLSGTELMEPRKQKNLSPKVMNELWSFVKKNTHKKENFTAFDASLSQDEDDENTLSAIHMENVNMSHAASLKNKHYIAEPMSNARCDLPMSQIFLTDDNGHRHRLRFFAIFRAMKPVFLQYRNLTENLGEKKCQTHSNFIYQRMHIPWTRRLVFRRKYRVDDQVFSTEQKKKQSSKDKLAKLDHELQKQRRSLKKKSVSAIFMKMNDMVVRFTATSLITIEQTNLMRDSTSKFYDGNYAHILSINNNDIVLVRMEIVNPILEPMLPINITGMNTYDKMIHIKYKCCFRNKAYFYSIPFSTLVYNKPVKKSFPLNWLKKPPKWLKKTRQERLGDPAKIKQDTIMQQCNAIGTSWFTIQTRNLRVRAQSRMFHMTIMFRRQSFEDWVFQIQALKVNDERTKRKNISCETCKKIELMVSLNYNFIFLKVSLSAHEYLSHKIENYQHNVDCI